MRKSLSLAAISSEAPCTRSPHWISGRGRNSRSGRIDDDERPTRRPGGESAEPSSRPERSPIQSDTDGAGGSSSTMTRPRAVMNQEGFPR
eukprot:scaffold6420_cov93-Isochrysis_galbana.AAC.1